MAVRASKMRKADKADKGRSKVFACVVNSSVGTRARRMMESNVFNGTTLYKSNRFL